MAETNSCNRLVALPNVALGHVAKKQPNVEKKTLHVWALWVV